MFQCIVQYLHILDTLCISIYSHVIYFIPTYDVDFKVIKLLNGKVLYLYPKVKKNNDIFLLSHNIQYPDSPYLKTDIHNKNT